MPPQPPLVALDRVVNQSMSSRTEASIQQFLKLWNSSESLQLLIPQILKRHNLRHRNRKIEISENRDRRNGTLEPSSEKDATKSFIEKAILSPAKVNDRIQESYGGLTRKDLLLLLEKHKAGRRSLGIYMLVRWWKKSTLSYDASADILLEQITLEYLSLAIAENRADFFEDIAAILTFLKEEEYLDNGSWNHDPGHWWQFHLLLYVLENPKEEYTIRQFVRYFQNEVGTNEMPTTKTLRNFCRTNGIALDSRPGAPKKSKTE